MQYTGLMSVYKSEKANLLKNALDSILSQTQKPSEFVLIKDGPLTPELDDCITGFNKEAELENINVKILENERNLGLGRSLQRGVKNCSFDWIARFDSDDVNSRTRMEQCIDYVEKNQQVKIIGGYIAEFSNSINEVNSMRKVPITDEEIKKRIKSRNPFNHMTVFFEKNAVLSVGNYQDVPYFEDYYLWFRLLGKGYKGANLPKTLVYAHVDDNFNKKRGGFQYLKKELYFQKLVFRKGYISLTCYLKNIMTRGMIRIVPAKLLGLIYNFLRR